MNLSEEEIKEILVEAYEAGWYGSLELKDECAELLLEKLRDKQVGTHLSSVMGWYDLGWSVDTAGMTLEAQYTPNDPGDIF